MFFRKEKKVVSKTRYVIVNGKDLVPLDELPGGGSIDDVGRSLGYAPKDFHVAYPSGSKLFATISVKMHSRCPIFVETLRDGTEISFSDVSNAIKHEIDWEWENRFVQNQNEDYSDIDAEVDAYLEQENTEPK